jgi:hypothetical protein
MKHKTSIVPSTTSKLAGLSLLAVLAIGTGLLLVDADYRGAFGLASLNLVAAVSIFVIAARADTGRALAAGSFLPLVVMAWPVPTIYFALADPNATYTTIEGTTRFLEGGMFLQWVSFVFLVGYGIGLLMVAGPKKAKEETIAVGGPERALIALGLAGITAGWLASLLVLSGPAFLIANALRNFFTGCLFIAGYRWGRLNRATKWSVAVVVAVGAVVNTIGNSRGFALWPIVLIAVGYFLDPGTTRRARTVLVVVGATALPVYSVVGNQTRLALGSIGFEDFGQRTEVLSASLTGGLLFEQRSFAGDLMGRMFSTGGHALVSRNWNSASLADLDVPVFLSDLAAAAIPAFISTPGPSRYAGTAVLRDYGFMITEKTSVEVSMSGSLFLAGGLPFVFVGAVLMGMLQSALFGWFWRRQTSTGIGVVGCLVSIGLGMYTLDPITATRTYLWTVLYVGAASLAVQALRRVLEGAVLEHPSGSAQ